MANKTEKPITGEYRVDVEDFGPISQASVELRPLTVFIGPSNTGKSYLSILLYALHQCFGKGIGVLRRYRYRPQLDDSPSLVFYQLADVNELGPAGKEEFRDWLKEQFKGSFSSSLEVKEGSLELKEGIDGPTTFDPLPARVVSYIRALVEQPRGFEESLGSQILRCFGVDHLHELIRKSESRAGARVRLSIPRDDSTGIMHYELKLRNKDTQFSGDTGDIGEFAPIPYNDMSLNAAAAGYGYADFGSGSNLKLALTAVTSSIFTSLLNPFCRNAHYLPADRTGVMHSHQVVVSTLVQNAAVAGIRPFGNTPILSGVLADFLSDLIGMRRMSRGRQHRKLEAVAARLEKNVLKGAVRAEHMQTGYPNFTYRPDGWKEDLELARVSSMVSELAPVALYLRHLMEPGDVLIIEEPEAHLHPAMQVAFMRELAAVVQAGVRVIVTTHSDWLLEELANMVRLSKIPEAERQGFGGGDVALRADQVGAWLFTHNEKRGGSIVKEIETDDSGLYPSDFDDVAVALHNKWANIDSKIENG